MCIDAYAFVCQRFSQTKDGNIGLDCALTVPLRPINLSWLINSHTGNISIHILTSQMIQESRLYSWPKE